MGMDRAKSLLEVRPGRSFLDIIAEQVLALREHLRRAAAGDLHEQLPHIGRHPEGAGRATRSLPVDRPAAGVPAEPRTEAAVGRPHAGQLAGRSRPGVVPAGSRRHLHRAGRLRSAATPCSTAASGTCSSPTSTTSAPDPIRGSPPGSPPRAPRSPPSSAGGPRPTARADTSPGGAATGSWCMRESAQTRPEDKEAFADVQPAPVLQHQQPVARPAPRCDDVLQAQRRCARAADHPQRQDRRSERPDLA